MVLHRRSLDLGVLLLCAVQFVDVLGVTSATTAIPAIVTELGASPTAVIAIASSYATFFGGFLVVGARLGDRYGHRRVLLAGLLVFAGVAVPGATAASVAQLVAARAAQGLAAAISIPSALRLLLHLTPEPNRRTAAIAVWSAAGAAAGATGFLLGGFLTDTWSWRAIFWVNLPIGLALGLAIKRQITSVPTHRGSTTRLDLVGAVLLVSALMALVSGAALAEHPGTRIVGAVMIMAGAGVGMLFRRQQVRTRDPLIPRAAWDSATLRIGAGLSFVNTATTSSSGVLLTLYLQQQLGDGPLRAGLQLLPLSLAVIIGSAGAKRLATRCHPPVLAGFGLLAISLGTMGLALAQSSRVGILVAVVVVGTGLGLASVAATTIGTDVPDDLAGTASGIINTAAQIGTALGIAVFLAVAAIAGSDTRGAVTAWVAIAGVAAVTAGCGFRARRCRR